MKTLFLFSACIVSITISSGRGPSSEAASRRSSQQQDLLASLAAIKAATAKIEECLAVDQSEVSSVISAEEDSRSDSPAPDTLQGLSLSQEELNSLVRSVYRFAVAKIKTFQANDVGKANTTEMALLSKQIQVVLNPSQAIADELAPQLLQVSNSNDVKQLRKMVLDAATASESLIDEYNKYVKSKIYKPRIEELRRIQQSLDRQVHEKLKDIVYDKEKSNNETDGEYYLSSHGRMLVNTFSKEYVKLGLMRKDGINDDKSLRRLESETPIAKNSVDHQIVTHAVEALARLCTNHLDLTISGVVVDYMLLLKSGINIPSLSHKYYIVLDKKLLKAELKDGRYVFNKDAKADYEMTEEELMALRSIVQYVFRSAFQNSNLRAHKFIPIRRMLSSKLDLFVNDNPENLEEASA